MISESEVYYRITREEQKVLKYGFDIKQIHKDIAVIRRSIYEINSIAMRSDLPHVNLRELSADIDKVHPFIIPHDSDDKIYAAAIAAGLSKENNLNCIFNQKLPYEKCIIYGFGHVCVVQLQPTRIQIVVYLHTSAIGRSLSYYATYAAFKDNKRVFVSLHNNTARDEKLEFAMFGNALQYTIYLSSIIENTEIEIIENPKEVQISRAKHHKAPLPDIRVLTGVRKQYPENELKGSHASPEPHNRRGTWCISKLGKKFWRKDAKVKGGVNTPVITIINEARND